MMRSQFFDFGRLSDLAARNLPITNIKENSHFCMALNGTALSYNPLSYVALSLVFAMMLFGTPAFAGNQSTQNNDSVRDTLVGNTPMDLSEINADPYELALTQVLAEICPPLLSPPQKQRFLNAYNLQMKSLIPTDIDSTMAMRQISSQKGYRNILQSVRSWTLSYPASENKALCIEFANSF